MDGEIYKKVIKKNAYRVFMNFKEALKIGDRRKIFTMEEKITIQENHFKETFMIGT